MRRIRRLELLEEFAAGARNEDATRHVTLAVLHALYDPGRLAALGAVSAFGRVHDFLAISRLGDLGHCLKLSC